MYMQASRITIKPFVKDVYRLRLQLYVVLRRVNAPLQANSGMFLCSKLYYLGEMSLD
jgi:hypothetical protein